MQTRRNLVTTTHTCSRITAGEVKGILEALWYVVKNAFERKFLAKGEYGGAFQENTDSWKDPAPKRNGVSRLPYRRVSNVSHS